MLLNSLLRRINGGTDTKSTKPSSSRRPFSLLPYEKYPNLSELTLGLLSPCLPRDNSEVPPAQLSSKLATAAAHKVFPGLEIVERFGLPQHRRLEIGELLRYHMADPVWPVREKAAKTLAEVLPETAIATEIQQMLEDTMTSQNRLHGKLLYVRFMLARVEHSIPMLLAGNLISRFEIYTWSLHETAQDHRLETKFLDAFHVIVVSNPCTITASVFLNIIADILEALRKFQGNNSQPSDELDLIKYLGGTELTWASKIERSFRNYSIGGKLNRRIPFPRHALLEKTLNRCGELFNLFFAGLVIPEKPEAYLQESCPWNDPVQGHQAVICYGRNLGICYVLNSENWANDMVSWTNWLRLAGCAVGLAYHCFILLKMI